MILVKTYFMTTVPGDTIRNDVLKAFHPTALPADIDQVIFMPQSNFVNSGAVVEITAEDKHFDNRSKVHVATKRAAIVRTLMQTFGIEDETKLHMFLVVAE